MVAKLKAEYDAWFTDVTSKRDYAEPSRTSRARPENPVLLTRQDWRGPNASWTPEGVGYWEVRVAAGRSLQDHAALRPAKDGKVHFALAGVTKEQDVKRGDTRAACWREWS